MREKLHIMAIGAHIIDAELSCGKTLAKHSLLGDKITTVALTAGENGHPAEFTKEEFREVNIKGATAFAEALGGKFICLGYDDANVPESEEIYNNVAELIRKEKPDVILTHWEGSYHEDHFLAPKIVRKAVRRAGFSDGEYPAHRVKHIYYAENWEDMKDFVPYLFVDVSGEAFELWNKAIDNIYLATHATYFDYKGYYEALSRVRGILAGRELHGCKRAECFAISDHERFRLTDIMDSIEI